MKQRMKQTTVRVTCTYTVNAKNARALREAMKSLRYENWPSSGYGYSEVGDLDEIEYWYEEAKRPKVEVEP